ncbi:MAG: DNA polymerase I, partial [Sporomusaceae bacterium]|nr:DNA polymerase I [Sporomusaceae bacterium]
MSARFVIIDGNSLMHRAFHALPMFHTKDGLYTNAVYGFSNMLIKVLSDFDPQYLAVAFDAGRLTFRNEVYPEYKALRKPTPPELSAQIPLVED